VFVFIRFILFIVAGDGKSGLGPNPPATGVSTGVPANQKQGSVVYCVQFYVRAGSVRAV
jgi:hypothetical protein